MRSILLPPPSPAVERAAHATLLATPARYGSNPVSEHTLSELIQDVPDVPINVMLGSPEPTPEYWLRDQVLRNLWYFLVTSHRGGLYWRDTSRRGNRDAMEDTIRALSRPIIRVNTDSWQTDRRVIIPKLEALLDEWQYPDAEAELARISRGNAWSRAEHRVHATMGNGRRADVSRFMYSYKTIDNDFGYRHATAIRKVEA